jgi:endogenous inhibitor of DNA gyrase (YacG/DUF329 family)
MHMADDNPPIECPFCGSEVDQTEEYCPECGTDLVDDEKQNY